MKAYIKNKTMSYEDKLCEVFSEYLSFINYPQVPFPNGIKIEVFDGRKDTHGNSFSQLHRIGKSGRNFEFFIEQNMFRSDQKATLYHEFTHIMDFLILNQNDNYEEIYDNLPFVAEIRASFVEYALITGSKNIFDMTAPSSLRAFKLNFNRKASSIYDLPKQYQNDIINTVSKNIDYSIEMGVAIIKQIAYYLGMCICISTKVDISIDHLPLIDFMRKYYGDKFTELINWGLNTNTQIKDINLAEIKAINQTYDECMEFYKKVNLEKMMQKFHNTDK